MANKRKPMNKIRKLIKLLDKGLNNSEISRTIHMDRKTISQYKKRIEDADHDWSNLDSLSDDDVYLKLFGKVSRVDTNRFSTLDLNYIQKELKKKSVTLKLLWDEYIENNPDGYQYTQFCEHFKKYKKKNKFSYSHNYQWGEAMFVDYAGQKAPIINPIDGSITEAHIFVGCLGASNYTYAEATLGETTKDWVHCHINAFEDFEGVPEKVVPDNPKALVMKADPNDPILNPVYEDMGDHYDVAIIPARVRKPKDKAKVEKEVQNAEQWILAKLRNHTFFSLDELNEAIWYLLEDFNSKDFQKRTDSRKLDYENYEKSALSALPKTRFEFYDKKSASVYIDYHVEVDKKYYSVPCHLVGEKVDVYIRPMTVTIKHKNRLICSHIRAFGQQRYITEEAHMPKNHQEYTKWTPERIQNWADDIDHSVGEMVRRIFNQYKHPELGIRSTMGIMGLKKKYSTVRIKAACERALKFNCNSYLKVKSILEQNLDVKEKEDGYVDRENKETKKIIEHENLRGPEYYS